MQWHGRAAHIERLLSFESMADEIVSLLQYLQVNNAAITSFSFGAIVELETVIKYPSHVNRLVFISAAYKPDCRTPVTRESSQ